MPTIRVARMGYLQVALATGLALGCATGTDGRGSGTVYGENFPSEQELARFENAPLPDEIFSVDLRDAREWAIEGSVPNYISAQPWIDHSVWGELLLSETDASDGRLIPTEAMNCIAREFARFALAHDDGQPDASLQRFIVGACNAPVPTVAFGSVRGAGGAALEQERLAEAWGSSRHGYGFHSGFDRYLGFGPNFGFGRHFGFGRRFGFGRHHGYGRPHGFRRRGHPRRGHAFPPAYPRPARPAPTAFTADPSSVCRKFTTSNGIGKTIKTTPTVTEESKAILLGQGADKIAA